MCGLCMRMIRCESSYQGLVKRGWKGEGRLWLKEGGPRERVFCTACSSRIECVSVWRILGLSYDHILWNRQARRFGSHVALAR